MKKGRIEFKIGNSDCAIEFAEIEPGYCRISNLPELEQAIAHEHQRWVESGDCTIWHEPANPQPITVIPQWSVCFEELIERASTEIKREA